MLFSQLLLFLLLLPLLVLCETAPDEPLFDPLIFSDDCAHRGRDFCGGIEAGTCVRLPNSTRSECYCSVGYMHLFANQGCVPKPSALSPLSSFACLCLALLAGKALRFWVRPLQVLYVPASLLGGTVAMLVIQLTRVDVGLHDYVERELITGWRDHPSFLINVIFGALFLGTRLPSLVSRASYRLYRANLYYGLFVAFAQAAVAAWFTALVLRPAFGVDHMFALVIPVGFGGGHATAQQLSRSFAALDYRTGAELSSAAATLGLLFAIIAGTVLVNVAVYAQWIDADAGGARSTAAAAAAARAGGSGRSRHRSASLATQRGVNDPSNGPRPVAGVMTVNPNSIDVVALHLAFVGLAVLFGWSAKSLLLLVEANVAFLRRYFVFQGLPTYPFVLIGSALLQLALQRYNRAFPLIDGELMRRISGTALDFLIVAALATIRVDAVKRYLVPFLLIVALGALLQLACVAFVARALFPARAHWFENAIGVFGQSVGLIATGLLLLRMTDASNRTRVMSAFKMKQVLHAPLMGGGIFTALALPLTRFATSFALAAVATLAAAFFFYLLWRRRAAVDPESAGFFRAFSDDGSGMASGEEDEVEDEEDGDVDVELKEMAEAL